MPLRDDILTPIPGEKPSGENLRNSQVYIKITEARRQEDDWSGGRKEADFKTVLKLAGDALATKSKDLQLAAWITEALLKRENLPGLRSGLELIKGLIENFWDSLYPELEDGDAEFRSAPVEWVGTRLGTAVKEAPVTRDGYSYFHYKEAQTVGFEADIESSDAMAKRQAAIDDKKVTGEAFEAQFNNTSKDFYKQFVADLDGCLETLEALSELCASKFGEFNPSFSPLRDSLQEVRLSVDGLYQKKRKQAGESDEPAEEREQAAEPEAPVAAASSWGEAAAAAPARAPAKKSVVGLVPSDTEDAVARLAAIAKFLREQDGFDPAPYLLLRGFRWGELRKEGASPSESLFEAPPTEVRTQLRKAIVDSDWTTAIELAETAMAQPCGRAWLDLQRYTVAALERQGYPQIASAIKSAVRGLLNDLPRLRRSSLSDDTPTANQETQQWLDDIVAEARDAGAAPAPAMRDEEEVVAEGGAAAPPDSYELAIDAIRQGRSKEAIEILVAEAAHQSSGRGRFRRKQQLAEVCIKLGHTAVAQSVLEELVEEIDEHKLEDWETPETVASPLTMLLDCLAKQDGDAEMRRKIYRRICRLDPVQALNCKP
jgi:type VI secretion system protein ImpA